MFLANLVIGVLVTFALKSLLRSVSYIRQFPKSSIF